MPGLRIAATLTALVALAVAPAAAQAAVTSTQITSWTSSESGDAPDSLPDLVDNPPNATTLTVNGDALRGQRRRRGRRCLLLRRRASPSVTKLAGGDLSVQRPDVHHGRLALKPIAGHACRLRAIPAGGESTAGPRQLRRAADRGLRGGAPVAISADANRGTAVQLLRQRRHVHRVLRGPRPVRRFIAFRVLIRRLRRTRGGADRRRVRRRELRGRLHRVAAERRSRAFGGRSEVQIDGRNAYDPAAAQSLSPGQPPSARTSWAFPRRLRTASPGIPPRV